MIALLIVCSLFPTLHAFTCVSHISAPLSPRSIEPASFFIVPPNQQDAVDDILETNSVSESTSRSNETSQIIRCAILGCGMMGQEHCSYILGYSSDLRIDFLCDPHKPSLDACIRVINEFQTKKQSSKKISMFQTESELLEHANDIDLLVVATPNYLHADTVVRWGRFENLTILVEKPVAVSSEEHAMLAEWSQSLQYKANLWVGMEYRFIPAIAKLISLIPSVVGTIHMVTIRENRYPFLHKIEKWNRDRKKTGDTLVEKCCHFFDLMRLISGQEAELEKIRSLVQRGFNYQEEEKGVYDVPIIDSAYVTMPFRKVNSKSKLIGCLELCMFAEGSRHQEEIIVTGSKGRLEAYLPENKVYAFHRPSFQQWKDRSIPPPKSSIISQVYDCSNVKDIHGIDGFMPTHCGYHYSSTAVEWYHLIHAMRSFQRTHVWKPHVSLQDGLRAVEIGLQATQAVVNEDMA